MTEGKERHDSERDRGEGGARKEDKDEGWERRGKGREGIGEEE